MNPEGFFLQILVGLRSITDTYLWTKLAASGHTYFSPLTIEEA